MDSVASLKTSCAAGAYATVTGVRIPHARVRHSRHASLNGAGTLTPGELMHPSVGTQAVDKWVGVDMSFFGANDGRAAG
ncbi:conserved protein of unknown function [Paraburkholderia dioscoreae]|uniref:Uncharacterized protein n=1 Tax=Paraburkholderia dioscoreae TaxID=2604047 RepID=A0A5Q4ZK79_9BURK|nr:conserved protein of unknown function [Paraburkholderia dioscoreae]